MSQSEHDHGGQSPFIQHHFDGAKHQFDSGKLGIWLFLVTEILFFSGLFVAYIVYRHHHPEVFEYAHQYLDKTLGAINTAVLIVSSLTAAWAVRAAQLGQRKILITTLAVTVLCAFGFLGIKAVEYTHKFHVGAYWGEKFDLCETPDGKPLPCEYHHGEHGEKAAHGEAAATAETAEAAHGEAAAAKPAHGEAAAAEAAHGDAAAAEGATAKAGAEKPAGDEAPADPEAEVPAHTSYFFSIYFGMTGLHGIHVLIGAFVFIWLLIRAIKGHFTPDYFGPIDYAALYWHLVDLIWIYLFPLLYLI